MVHGRVRPTASSTACRATATRGDLRRPASDGNTLSTFGPSTRTKRERSAALLAALATGRGLLCLVAAASAAAALLAAAAAAALPTPARRAGRVRDRSRARLAHALLAQPLVLLVVLDAGSV